MIYKKVLKSGKHFPLFRERKKFFKKKFFYNIFLKKKNNIY